LRHRIAIPGLFTLALLTAATPAHGDEPAIRLVGFGSICETQLKAPALSGKPAFVNHGAYAGIEGEISVGNLDLIGRYQTGQGHVIPGGNLMPPAPTFQPLTGERTDVLDVLLGYTVLKGPALGSLAVGVGFYRLWAVPMISPANWYQGYQVGVAGRKEWRNHAAIACKIGYVPAYTVNGYVSTELRHNDIWLGKLEGDLPVCGPFFLNVGYQAMSLHATAIKDGSTATVNFGGFFLGGGFRF